MLFSALLLMSLLTPPADFVWSGQGMGPGPGLPVVSTLGFTYEGSARTHSTTQTKDTYRTVSMDVTEGDLILITGGAPGEPHLIASVADDTTGGSNTYTVVGTQPNMAYAIADATETIDITVTFNNGNFYTTTDLYVNVDVYSYEGVLSYVGEDDYESVWGTVAVVGPLSSTADNVLVHAVLQHGNGSETITGRDIYDSAPDTSLDKYGPFQTFFSIFDSAVTDLYAWYSAGANGDVRLIMIMFEVD